MDSSSQEKGKVAGIFSNNEENSVSEKLVEEILITWVPHLCEISLAGVRTFHRLFLRRGGDGEGEGFIWENVATEFRNAIYLDVLKLPVGSLAFA